MCRYCLEDPNCNCTTGCEVAKWAASRLEQDICKICHHTVKLDR